MTQQKYKNAKPVLQKCTEHAKKKSPRGALECKKCQQNAVKTHLSIKKNTQKKERTKHAKQTNAHKMRTRSKTKTIKNGLVFALACFFPVYLPLDCQSFCVVFAFSLRFLRENAKKITQTKREKKTTQKYRRQNAQTSQQKKNKKNTKKVVC